MPVISIKKPIAIKSIKDILEIEDHEAKNLYENLESGRTLAESLRALGFRSVSEIDYSSWERLRQWRSRYFPLNVKVIYDDI